MQVQKLEIIEKRFNVKISEGLDYQPGYNVSPGQKALVVANNKSTELQLFTFGMTPFWAKKQMYLFNARSEGDLNKENDPKFRGAKGIINKPSFRKPIRSQRCLVIADAFIEGTTKERLDKPYVVYLKDEQRPFAFAGIWDTWVNKETGEEIPSFSIITTVANELLQKIPHHRSPVILNRHDEQKWLDEKRPLSDVTELLRPYPSEKMNAYPIAKDIKNPRAEGPELIEPVGQRLTPEYETTAKKGLILQGMGANKKPDRDPNRNEKK